MRDFLLANCPTLIWVICGAELLLFFILISKYLKARKAIVLCMALIAIGLFLDAFLIVIGQHIPSSVFEPVSRVRFIAHGVLIPLIFPICAYALHLKKKALKAVWFVTALLMVAGLMEALATVLETKKFAGVVRCVSSASTPSWANTVSMALSFGTVIPLMICGIIVWAKQKTPTLFLSGFLMFLFSALGPATGNSDLIFFITMFGELFMILFFWLYSRKYKESSPKKRK